MPRIQYINDKTGGFQETHGSDSRLNVSARSDERGYYNSRDEGRCFTVPWTHLAGSDGEYGLYLQNTSPSRELVVSSISISSDTADTRFKLWFVTGTAGDGVVVTPTNLNRTSSNAAEVNAREAAGGTSISGLTASALIDFVHLDANGHEEFHLLDRVRLGQNDAIALEADENMAGTTDAGGVCFFYFE